MCRPFGNWSATGLPSSPLDLCKAGTSSQASTSATITMAAVSVLAIALLYRPLLLSSVLAEVGQARGVSAFAMELCFLLVVALATTMTVPVVGTLLIFSLMIGAPAAARSFTSRPLVAMGLSVAIALLIVWVAIAASYQTNYPVGFFVGTISAGSYALGRGYAALRRSASASLPS